MSEQRAAYTANLPAAYDARRRGAGMEIDPLPGMGWRMETTYRLLEWCWAQQPDLPRAVLDLHAGCGNLGQYALLAPVERCTYHATEQSEQQCAEIRFRVPAASVAHWRCEPDGEPLWEALASEADTFLTAYPAVLFSHGPEHHADPYYAMEQAYSLVRPGGYLLVVAARNDAHRSHFRKYTLDDLIELCGECAGITAPLVVWPFDYWADLYVAVPKPEDDTPPDPPANVTVPAREAVSA